VAEAVVSIPAGEPEYSRDDAQVSIDSLLDMLQEAKEDGATHVVMGSGNHRGPKWARLDLSYEWVD
jgi:hypothetical protein